MGHKCSLTGKKRMVANKVSHAKNRTKTIQRVNLKTKKIFDPKTGKSVKLRLSAKAIRNLDKTEILSDFFRKNSSTS